jgi:vanillate O-demethylase ferredoxin subunit
MLLRVRSITFLAEGINGYELVDPAGSELPAFTAGAHVDVRLGDGLIRQYSLCNDPAERRRYSIAVLKEPESRGGSRLLHETVRVGDRLEVSAPRNNFPLAETAERHVLLAGGIGVTPMMSMIAELKRRDADFIMHYCTRAPERMAFGEELAPLVAGGRVFCHHDGGDPARGLDVAATLRAASPGTHLYYCGPAGFMTAISAAAGHWPQGSVHCEYFSAPAEGAAAPRPTDQPFRVRLAGNGAEYEVLPGETIIAVLRRHGIAVDTSCEDGYCGTCMTPYLAGEPEHRDQVLDAESRKRYVLICCARSRTPVLELDL